MYTEVPKTQKCVVQYKGGKCFPLRDNTSFDYLKPRHHRLVEKRGQKKGIDGTFVRSRKHFTLFKNIEEQCMTSFFDPEKSRFIYF